MKSSHIGPLENNSIFGVGYTNIASGVNSCISGGATNTAIGAYNYVNLGFNIAPNIGPSEINCSIDLQVETTPDESGFLIGYFASGQAKPGYNYSELYYDDRYFYRSTLTSIFFDHKHNKFRYPYNITECNRYRHGSCKKQDCHLCVQLDVIQQDIFKNDHDMEFIFKNIHKYGDDFVLARIKKPLLDFKFNYDEFDMYTGEFTISKLDI
jgi:hypothetical protein